MISHRRGQIQQQQQSSRFVAAASAATGAVGLPFSNNSSHSNGSNHGSSPLMAQNNCDYNSSSNSSAGSTSTGSVSCGSASASPGSSPLLTTMIMPSAQTIQNGYSRRKRSTPVLTEDRLMSLLLLLVAVWFLYVRYEETKAFHDSQSVSKKNGKRPSHYTPSDEYIAALNMEKKRDYDAHLNRMAALNAASHNNNNNNMLGQDGFNNIRLYPDTMGDDDSLIEAGYSNQYSNLRGSDFITERDTGLFTPAEIRLKMVEHGGLDTGGFDTSITSAYKHDSQSSTQNKAQSPTYKYPQFEDDPTTKQITRNYRPITPVKHANKPTTSTAATNPRNHPPVTNSVATQSKPQPTAASQTKPHSIGASTTAATIENAAQKPYKPRLDPVHQSQPIHHDEIGPGNKSVYIPKRTDTSDPTKMRRDQVYFVSPTEYLVRGPDSRMLSTPLSNTLPLAKSSTLGSVQPHLYVPKRVRDSAMSP